MIDRLTRERLRLDGVRQLFVLKERWLVIVAGVGLTKRGKFGRQS